MKWILLLAWVAVNNGYSRPNSAPIAAPTQIGPFATFEACEEARKSVMDMYMSFVRADTAHSKSISLAFERCLPVNLAP